MVEGGVVTRRLAPGVAVLSIFAERLVEACRARLPDLSGITVVVPNLLIAPALRSAIARAVAGPVLLPRIVTLSGWADLLLDGFEPRCRRQLQLFAALSDWRWFEGSSRWQMADALAELFDELTQAGLALPDDAQDLQEQLSRGYDLQSACAEQLSFEASFVHALWRADRHGLPSQLVARIQRLDAIADHADQPLFVLWEGEPAALESAFMAHYARRQPVELFLPDRRQLDFDPALGLLNVAWPVEPASAATPLLDRIRALESLPPTSLGDRLSLVSAGSLEALARHVALQVKRWLVQGRDNIALIAADRVAARRARALLERDGILVTDETGWKLSTTRAAALIDAWLEVLAADGYHRDILDLVKSPFVAAELSSAVRASAIDAIERCIAERNIVAGLETLASAIGEAPQYRAALPLLERVHAARAAHPLTLATPAQWIDRLVAALRSLGADECLAADAAGSTVLDLLSERRAELANVSLKFAFADWREWLDRQLEAAAFRDVGIDSPVVMTHLAAIRLRNFAAAIVIGADREHLAPAASAPLLSNDAVRRELGLSDSAHAIARLRDDLALLVAQTDVVCFAWQGTSAGEEILPAVEIELLSLAHHSLFGDDLRRSPMILPKSQCISPEPQRRPAPASPAELLPQRVSASALQSLVNCPYQFFSRYVLGLGERDEVTEVLEKRDYGERVHDILARFHRRFPVLTGIPFSELLSALETESRMAFAHEIEVNYLESAWLARWERRLPAYLQWQLAREAAGWFFDRAELAADAALPLADGAQLRLVGRLDRLDCCDAAEARSYAVLDYKNQSRQALNDKLRRPGEDVQLAVYTLLQGDAVSQAAYVALDDERIDARALPEPQAMAAAQRQRFIAMFDAMHAESPLPAHGTESVCRYCEMRGLCRRDYVE